MRVGTLCGRTSVSIEDWLGSWTRKGKVFRAFYVENKVDLAFVKLTDDEEDFANMFNFCTEQPDYDQQIWVLGFDRFTGFTVTHSSITGLITHEEEITMCAAQYYSYDGLCGGGVVVCDNGGGASLIGLHCLTQ
jgi:hypothetical protein